MADPSSLMFSIRGQRHRVKKNELFYRKIWNISVVVWARLCYNKGNHEKEDSAMKKVRIGVLGVYRGTSMINYCKRSDHAEVVAICDKSKEILSLLRKQAVNTTSATYPAKKVLN